MIPASAVRFGTEPTAPPSRIESMTLDVVVRFLSEVVRSLFGTGIWCAVMQIAHAAFGVTPMPFVIPPNPTSRNPLHAVAATDAGTFVVTFVVGGGGADRAFYREIAKVGGPGWMNRCGFGILPRRGQTGRSAR